jgi:hypothetical protein
MFSWEKNVDYLIGGTMLISAPLIPNMVKFTHFDFFNDGLTLTIQILSIVLLGLRIKSQMKKEDE